MDLITAPPPASAISAMLAIDGVQVVPAMLASQAGPERHLGPESAGAILMLQGTFADPEKFAGFWEQAAALMAELATAPGFIRRYNFTDGPHYTLLAWWRSVEDAQAFFASPAHQAAMRTTFEQRWNYTHFAGLWETVSPRRRLFFCQACEGVMPSASTSCTECGAALFDPYGDSDVRSAASLPR